MKNTGERYDWQGIIVITILMIVSFLILYFSWGNVEISYANFTNYITIKGFEFIVAIFFISIGAFSWCMYIVNVLISPKNETVYLNSIEGHIYSFLDVMGNKYMYTNYGSGKYILGKYYLVSKTRNIIKEVISDSNIWFKIPREKVSYWLNLYTLFGNFENLLLLPILYVVLVMGLISLINGDLINAVISIFVASSNLIYDAIYKSKRLKIIRHAEEIKNVSEKNAELNDVDSSAELVSLQNRAEKTAELVSKFARLIPGLILVGFCLWMAIASKFSNFIVILTPFAVIGVVILIKAITDIITYFDNSKDFSGLVNISKRIFRLVFSLCCVAFLLFYDYIALTTQQYALLGFTIPFWAVVVCMIYKVFKY